LDVYHTILPVEEVLYKDKASKFIGYAFPVKDEQDIKKQLEQLRNQHPKATHHCYAYRLGLDKNNYRANDDGEPNGTAGRPILGQMDSFGITNCLIVVVRYFGGTKLGVPGLIDAYKETAKQTIEATTILEQRIFNYYEVICSYEQINKVYQVMHRLKATITDQYLDNTSIFKIEVAQDKSTSFEAKLIGERIEYKLIERN